MASIRLRHPAGVATIQVPLDRATFTVQDLQQQIHAITKILPSRQSLKAGYPPQPLTIVPELPIESLGLKPGEQIIVNELPGIGSSAAPSAASPAQEISSSLLSPSPPPARAPVPVPLPDVSSNTSPPKQDGPDHVETDGGVLVHRIVPDDNSCLFSSVALLFEQSIDKAADMRKIVADGIRKHPDKYNEAILGMPPDKYIDTILKPATWGGAIELAILATHYRTEIASIDVESGRVDHFSPPADNSGGMRCILIYSGIHYDAATLAPMPEAPGEWHQTMFPLTPEDDQDAVIIAAKKLATVLRAKKAYTNTATFDLKCEVCDKGLKGEKDARAHAAETGHVRFGEY